MRKRFAVIGGSNMDIGGFSSRSLVARDSNIGRVSLSPGGVGRNIAENLARMGQDVQLFSAIGDDSNGRGILKSLTDAGIGFDHGIISKKNPSSVYLYIADSDGDMFSAINDMRAQEEITPEYILKNADVLNAMDAVCIDANLTEDTIRAVVENVHVPIFADPVSAAKTERLNTALPYLYAIKPNRLEAELMTNVMITSKDDAIRAAKRFLAMGVKNVFLTVGVHGVVCADEQNCEFLRSKVLPMVSASGAGDAFTAALLYGFANDMSLQDCCRAGMAAASIAVESDCAVNPEMTEDKLKERIASLVE